MSNNEKPDGRELRICEASLSLTQAIADMPHISDDEILVAILRISPRLVRKPRRKKSK